MEYIASTASSNGRALYKAILLNLSSSLLSSKTSPGDQLPPCEALGASYVEQIGQHLYPALRKMDGKRVSSCYESEMNGLEGIRTSAPMLFTHV